MKEYKQMQCEYIAPDYISIMANSCEYELMFTKAFDIVKANSMDALIFLLIAQEVHASEIARRLYMHRTNVHRRIKRMRQKWQKAGVFDGYNVSVNNSKLYT
jgi:biotin operon repressor